MIRPYGSVAGSALALALAPGCPPTLARAQEPAPAEEARAMPRAVTKVLGRLGGYLVATRLACAAALVRLWQRLPAPG